MSSKNGSAHKLSHLAATVAAASVRTYPPDTVTTMDAGRCCTIVLPNLRRVEEVVTDLALTDDEKRRLENLRKDFEVWVLVPLSEIGAAHTVLRGVADRVQPWWQDGPSIQFGAPRIP
jgi:hypothetical protein